MCSFNNVVVISKTQMHIDWMEHVWGWMEYWVISHIGFLQWKIKHNNYSKLIFFLPTLTNPHQHSELDISYNIILRFINNKVLVNAWGVVVEHDFIYFVCRFVHTLV